MTRGLKLVAVGIMQAMFGILIMPTLDAFSPRDLSITRIAFIVIGSGLAILGIFDATGGTYLRRFSRMFSEEGERKTNRRVYASISHLALSVMILTVYAAVAEILGFYLITLPTPGRSVFIHRLSECSIVWVLFWTALGWFLYLRRVGFQATWMTWVVILLPLGISVIETTSRALVQFNRPNSLPAGWFRFLLLASPLIVLLKGMLLSGWMFLQMKVWIRLTKKGVCQECGYNLRGNVSGVCPECGRVVPTIATRT